VSNRLLRALFFTCLCVFSSQALARADYPNKPITLLVGSAPGGSNDVFARALSKRLQDLLGQPVVIENKPAAGGILANNMVAKAAADGYTLVVLSSTFTTGAAIRRDLQYDPIKSFTPIAMLAKGPLLITVNNNTPFSTLSELIAYARQHPGKVNYGTSGVGSINQFGTEVFAQVANIKLTHVPYKGMGPAVTDLLGGQIDLITASAPSLLGQVKSQKIRALAVTTSARSKLVPDLPSLKEAGLDQSSVDLWWGVLAPAGTPEAVVALLNRAINQIMSSPEMLNFLEKEGAESVSMSSSEFATYIGTEIERWRRVAQIANIEPD
jgi:tripartite-type tricarboxylate transporter receptor subunit TctC